jgi:hypothetical protein
MANVRRQLQTAGNRRAKARAEALRQSEIIRELIPQALDAGLTKSEIARLAQISRPALDAMLKDAPPSHDPQP